MMVVVVVFFVVVVVCGGVVGVVVALLAVMVSWCWCGDDGGLMEWEGRVRSYLGVVHIG